MTSCEQTYHIPQEKDINLYMTRAIQSISSITSKESKDLALMRLNNIVTDITTIVNGTG
jgi:hypothetical protein